ncbi:GNAT family N-acetyltransferase [Antribacter gilvus]|uniref:GNAT family N-acetyltransferase n=1 Tax=Antribacter gilvus TaxID=2304675 RepID=UPI000F7A0338|nr:GNAT family N-acetyltransferase [Antribacter gilvus]
MTLEELRAAFHEQVRLADRDADQGDVVEHDGPVRRHYPAEVGVRTAYVESPEGLGDDPAATIARQRDFFLDRGQPVEWKTYAYDEPADLGMLLVAAGFVPEDDEALILGETAHVVEVASPLPSGLTVRAVDDDADVDRLADLHELVWPGSRAVSEHFRAEMRARPDLVMGCLVEESRDGPALCGSWLRLVEGTDFGGLWGGATHPGWRHRGLYRATVAHRARLALDAGHPYLRVDASRDSRPVLERAGLHQVSTTTPYVLSLS